MSRPRLSGLRSSVVAAALVGLLTAGGLVSGGAVATTGAAVADRVSTATAAADVDAAEARRSRDGQPVVRTSSGRLRGIVASWAEQFLGVPYAAPPIKSLRFAPTAEPASWSGVRAADRQSPACLQFQPTGIREEQATSEDCLYLDLYRAKGVSKGDKRPVLVWFHGGAWTQGSGVLYGGSTMARQTGAIVISINYRLGALGFLAHPALSAETPMGSGNYGLMDQIQSLNWVKNNIAAFGGDPSNVTIFGQSAGAGSVCGLLAAPSAKDLFDRAIVQSLACSWVSTTLAAGETSGETFATQVGCTDAATVLACLRKAWAPSLVAAQQHYTGGIKVGGELLPVAPAQAIASGNFNKVPVMIGTTKSEFRLLSTAQAAITAQGYADAIRSSYGDRAEQVLALYPLSKFASPYDALTQVQTDAAMSCGVDRTASALAAHVATYQYEFDDPTSPTLYGFAIEGVDMANAHSAELQYLFDFTLGERDLTRTQEKLAAQMVRYWGAFAKLGAPRVKGAPQWPAYGTGNVMSLRSGGASKVITTFTADHNCSFWAG